MNMGFDDGLVLIATLIALSGGIVSIMPPQKKASKSIVTAWFVVLSVASFFLSSAIQRRDAADKKTAIAQERQNQTTIQDRLDKEIRNSATLATALAGVRSIVATGAQKQDVISIIHILADIGRTNGQIYCSAMSIGNQLRSLGGSYRLDMLAYQKDERQKLQIALRTADNKNIMRVKRHNAAEQQSLKDTFRQKLLVLLRKASVVQIQLTERLPNVQQPSSDVTSLVRTGRPDNSATVQELGEYLVELAQKLPDNQQSCAPIQ